MWRNLIACLPPPYLFHDARWRLQHILQQVSRYPKKTKKERYELHLQTWYRANALSVCVFICVPQLSFHITNACDVTTVEKCSHHKHPRDGCSCIANDINPVHLACLLFGTFQWKNVSTDLGSHSSVLISGSFSAGCMWWQVEIVCNHFRWITYISQRSLILTWSSVVPDQVSHACSNGCLVKACSSRWAIRSQNIAMWYLGSPKQEAQYLVFDWALTQCLCLRNAKLRDCFCVVCLWKVSGSSGRDSLESWRRWHNQRR